MAMRKVYLIRCNDLAKIGIAIDPVNRVASLQTGNPYPLILEAAYEFQNADVVEQVLHQKFSSIRVQGEWFSMSDTDRDEFVKVCELLGGVRFDFDTGNEGEVILEREEPNAADWRIEITHGGKYFQYRERRRNGKVRYGGKFTDLPKDRQREYHNNRLN